MLLPIPLLLLFSSAPAHAEVPTPMLIEPQRPAEADGIDVITDELWERFARHNQ